MSVSWKWYVIMSIFIMRVVRASVMCVCVRCVKVVVKAGDKK